MTGLDIALVVLGFSFLLSLGRAARGPTLADRAAAIDVCLFMVVASMGVFAVRARTEAFVDVVVVATLLGFLATVAIARLVLRSRR